MEEEGVCSETHTNAIIHNETCIIAHSIRNALKIHVLYLFLWLIQIHPFLLLFIPNNLKNKRNLLNNAMKQDKTSRKLLEVCAYSFVLVVWEMSFILPLWIQPGQPAAATRSLMKNQNVLKTMQHSLES